MLAGVQAQAEYEDQDGVPGGTSPSIGRPEAHRGNGRLHSYTRFDYISSNDAKGYNNRGASYQELKRYRETLIDYEKAIKLNPGNADVYELKRPLLPAVGSTPRSNQGLRQSYRTRL